MAAFHFLQPYKRELMVARLTSCWNLVSEILMTKFVNSHQGENE